MVLFRLHYVWWSREYDNRDHLIHEVDEMISQVCSSLTSGFIISEASQIISPGHGLVLHHINIVT